MVDLHRAAGDQRRTEEVRTGRVESLRIAADNREGRVGRPGDRSRKITRLGGRQLQSGAVGQDDRARRQKAPNGLGDAVNLESCPCVHLDGSGLGNTFIRAGSDQCAAGDPGQAGVGVVPGQHECTASGLFQPERAAYAAADPEQGGVVDGPVSGVAQFDIGGYFMRGRSRDGDITGDQGERVARIGDPQKVIDDAAEVG